MSMRITTNGVFNGYRSDLANSYWKFSKSMTKVTTQRNFGAYAEDVSAASRAFQLRRSHWRAETQINNSNYVISKFETAWSAIDYIVDGTGADDNLNSIVESLRGLNGPTGSARVPLGQSVLSKADSIVRLLNTQYGDQFIFAGADGKNVPFAWETDEAGNMYLTYRGIDVSTPTPIMSAEELKKHISVKYNPEETESMTSTEELELQNIADQIGAKVYPDALPGEAELTYDKEADGFVLSWTDGSGETHETALSVEEVVEKLDLQATDDTGEIKYSYSLGAQHEEGGTVTLFTTATTVTKEESWEIVVDDALTGQGFTFSLPDPAVFDKQEAAQAALDGLDFDALFEEYKTQFNEKYKDYTHGDEDATAYENYEKLLKMSQEATYVDVGIGMDWYTAADGDKAGDLISSSAYNSALNGLSFLGFGSTVGDDGKLHSNNLVMLMQEMGTMLKDCDPDTGTWPTGWDTDRVSALTRMIDDAVDNVSVEHIRLSGEATYLQTNLTQLTAQRDNLNEQILNIEQIDPADAISEFLYARYAYNAALSVGNSILTNTLLDYLR